VTYHQWITRLAVLENSAIMLASSTKRTTKGKRDIEREKRPEMKENREKKGELRTKNFKR
jgi:hypothetical protein